MIEVDGDRQRNGQKMRWVETDRQTDRQTEGHRIGQTVRCAKNEVGRQRQRDGQRMRWVETDRGTYKGQSRSLQFMDRE